MTAEAMTVPSRQDVRSLLGKFAETAAGSPQPSYPPTIRQFWEDAGAAGLLAPAEAVGPEWRRFTLVVAEELGRHWLLDLPLWLQSDVLPTVLRLHGTPGQQALLAEFARGSAVVSAALTETANASSLTGLASTARPVADGYLINADKRHISNSVIADYIAVSASVGEDGLSTGLFLVPRDTPGIEVTPTSMGLGLELLGTGTVTFTDVRVPAETLLGGVADAGGQLQSAMALEWFFLALMSNAAAWSVVDGTYARVNAPRGAGPLLGHSSVQHRVAELVSRLYTVTALIRTLGAGYVETGAAAADLAAVSKNEATQVLLAALDLESGLRGAADLAASPATSRADVDGRRRAAAAQALAGGATHALHGVTLAGLATRVGQDPIF